MVPATRYAVGLDKRARIGLCVGIWGFEDDRIASRTVFWGTIFGLKTEVSTGARQSFFMSRHAIAQGENAHGPPAHIGQGGPHAGRYQAA